MTATCPYCAEAIPAQATTCPACGERLQGAPPPPRPSRLPLVLALVVTVVFGLPVVVGVLAALLMPSLLGAKAKANRTRCANNLRMLALAAIQYSDDKRAFPHARAAAALDGDPTTGDSPRVVRTLVWFGYHDMPEGFVCRASDDQAVPITNPATQADLRRWFWGGGTSAAKAPPFVDGQQDPPLDQTTELSYGWTRRALGANARSTALLAGDRALRDPSRPVTNALVGNHPDGWSVVQADASTAWHPAGTSPAWLAATADPQQDGFLCIDPPPP